MPMKYTKNEEGDFVCPDCGVTKKRQNSMHYHMKKHLAEAEEPSFDHVCSLCQKGFLQKQTLDLHMKSKHVTEKEKTVYLCPHCDFKSATKANCIIHCIRMHYQEEVNEVMIPKEKGIDCSHCDTTFRSASAFYYHLKYLLE